MLDLLVKNGESHGTSNPWFKADLKRKGRENSRYKADLMKLTVIMRDWHCSMCASP